MAGGGSQQGPRATSFLQGVWWPPAASVPCSPLTTWLLPAPPLSLHFMCLHFPRGHGQGHHLGTISLPWLLLGVTFGASYFPLPGPQALWSVDSTHTSTCVCVHAHTPRHTPLRTAPDPRPRPRPPEAAPSVLVTFRLARTPALPPCLSVAFFKIKQRALSTGRAYLPSTAWRSSC